MNNERLLKAAPINKSPVKYTAVLHCTLFSTLEDIPTNNYQGIFNIIFKFYWIQFTKRLISTTKKEISQSWLDHKFMTNHSFLMRQIEITFYARKVVGISSIMKLYVFLDIYSSDNIFLSNVKLFIQLISLLVNTTLNL